MKLSEKEQQLIIRAIQNADCIGAGPLTYAQEAIEDENIGWTEEHEFFALNYMEKLNY